MNDTYSYEVNLQWNSETKGTLSSPIITSEIEVVTPPEFPNGIKEKWTPENSKLDFISFESNAVAKIEKVEGKFAVTEIVLKPKLVIPSTQHEDRARRILEMSEKNCAISNSIKSKISLEPSILVK